MTFFYLPALLATCFARLASGLDARSALRLPLLPPIHAATPRTASSPHFCPHLPLLFQVAAPWATGPAASALA